MKLMNLDMPKRAEMLSCPLLAEVKLWLQAIMGNWIGGDPQGFQS
jgi:hypothetical protein